MIGWPFDGWYVVDLRTGCWNWRGHINNKGYGAYSRGGRHVYAHRFSYEREAGPIPDGLVIDHLCRNPRCVNPAHLEPVAFAENLRRGVGTKLTVEAVEDIKRRRANGESTRSIAALYGVHQAHVSRVATGKRWVEGRRGRVRPDTPLQQELAR